MPSELFAPEVADVLDRARARATAGATKSVLVDGVARRIPDPFPSPGDWRDCPIYFLLLDRFDDPGAPPASTRAAPPVPWNGKWDFRQGGTFAGVRRRLGYLADLGMRALWLSPVLRNSRPDDWRWNYHGYGIQDFLNVDERFASDGTRATAERELAELVDEAHARGLYVILDVVLNHAARVFDYVRDGTVVDGFGDAALLHGPEGGEPPVRWLDGTGRPRAEWQDALPPPGELGSDDAVWPAELQRAEFFRRRGAKLDDRAPPGGFARGDFGSMRQLAVEWPADRAGREAVRAAFGPRPVLSLLVRAHQYLVARYDVDGFRIDTVKYVDPAAMETFGNAMREFALGIGKANFFTFAEVYDDEHTIAAFVGRNTPGGEGFGIDAALDFPLFFRLPRVAKGQAGVETIPPVFLERRRRERELLSTHGEAGRFFVSFLDNHDQHERFNHPETPAAQVTLGLTLLFALQGIPCVYYGTEQGLQGAVGADGRPALDANESVREALWGREDPDPFDAGHPMYERLRALAAARRAEPALRYGRLYFRELSGNGRDFGHSTGAGGVLAFSRILADREVVVVANTSATRRFDGDVLVDLDLARGGGARTVAYSNLGTTGGGTARLVGGARFHEGDTLRGEGDAAALAVGLAPMEAQILVPA